jgi:DNA-binding NtrC family response regulator
MPRTVVLIDDDQDDLDILKEAILKVDANSLCTSFIYPDEAIRVISKELTITPTYLFVDINMPRMSGDKCVSALRKQKMFDNSIITVLSTSLPHEVSKALKDLGANFTFQKPLNMDGYIRILQNVFSLDGMASNNGGTTQVH